MLQRDDFVRLCAGSLSLADAVLNAKAFELPWDLHIRKTKMRDLEEVEKLSAIDGISQRTSILLLSGIFLQNAKRPHMCCTLPLALLL